jgi:1-deoxy-D-xylulose-5-phosphate synthase
VVPVPQTIVDMSRDYRLVVTIEDGVRVAGIGTRIRQDLRAAGVDTPLDELGLPDEFLDHGSRDELLADAGLTDRRIARDIVAQVLGTGGARIPVARPLPEDAETVSHEESLRRDETRQ